MARKPRTGRLAAPLALLVALVFVAAAPVAFAQEEAEPALGSSTEDDDLFGGDEVVVESEENDASIREAFLKTAAPAITGTFTGSIGASATWDDPWGASGGFFSPDASTFDPLSELAIGFSAKPEADLGFYGEVRTAYPFVDAEGDIDLRVFKLYSKFSWDDRLFFSFGKQPLKWGKGYFFAPANDILSLGAIDYLDPEADREGPLSLKAHMPFLGSMMNAYLFLIAPSGADHLFDVAIAPKIEVSLPSLEFGLSGYYQRDDDVRAILSGSWTKNGWTAFGEGVLKFGSDRLFIEEDGGGGYLVADRSDEVFFTGTAGMLYSDSWEKKLSLTAVAQYLYDGEAQENLSWNDVRLAALSDPMTFSSTTFPRMGTRLGRHYGAVSVNASEILDTKLGASVFVMANVADFSGWVRPQVSYEIFKRLTVSVWAQIHFGGAAGEYTDPAQVAGMMADPFALLAEPALTPPLTLGFKLSLGTGSF